MEDFFTYDPLASGSKGLIFIGEHILVYRRDGNTPKHPFHIDLPGGGPEPGETPFETFQREAKEEFDVTIAPEDVVYVEKYSSEAYPGKNAYYPVVKLPKETEAVIKLGDEGLQYMLMTLSEYLELQEVAWPILQEKALAYSKRPGA